MNHPKKDKQAQKAFVFLRAQQQSDGSFLSHSSPWPYKFQNRYTYKTTFANSVILRCLASFAQNKDITTPLAHYIRSQMHTDGAYNYWDTAAPEYTTLPYPNDLDDTFCALSALAAQKPSAIDGADMARITVLLTQTESQPGGPYVTWLTNDPRTVWKDIDVVVNANILYFLHLQDIDQPRLQTFIIDAIQSRQFYSPYYPSQFHVLYFLCFAARESHHELAAHIDKLLRLTQPRSALEYAMLVTTLEHIAKPQLAASYRKILSSLQAGDGSWPAAALCIDPARDSKKHFNGSTAITTAFALQALLYRVASTRKTQPPTSPALIHKTLRTAALQIADIDSPLQKDLGRHITYIAEGRYAHEIVASPYVFYKSLSQTNNTLPRNFLESVSTANTFGWIAYTIYDDFIDEEGIPGLLPTANVAHRKSLLNFFQAVSYKPNFREYIVATFNKIDTANKWELDHCRMRVHDEIIEISTLPDFGDYKKVAEKSMGHILPFLLVSLYCGLSLADKKFARLESALTHYLIARQLHDDIHDWQADMSTGHISPVVAAVLEEQHIIPGMYPITMLTEKAQDGYWRKALPAVCKTITQHLAAARSNLAMINYDSTSLLALIERLEEATTKTIAQQKDTLLFLDTYRRLTEDRNRTSED